MERIYLKRLIFLLFIATSLDVFSQSVTVLPNNGSYSQSVAPQGAFRFQRQFYLIKPSEMLKSGFQNGMLINAIGFTNGVAQSDTTKAPFKVYLQNTTDTVSRTDTNFTVVTSSTNSYHLTGLVSGNYEWQVTSVCSGSPIDTARTSFSNANLSDCNQPTNFITDNITSTSATFHWTPPASLNVIKYVVQFTKTDTVNWITDTITASFKNVSGLLPGKNYKWRVKTICSTDTSDFNGTSFSTETSIAGCNPPTALSTSAITGTSVTFSWTAAVGATYYGIQYRRIGTVSWTSIISVPPSRNITGLKPGTTYEWRIRTTCSLGNGAYVSGISFTTTGATACYSPEGLSSDSLTDSTAVFTWISTGASSYTIRYRLKDFINWTNAFTPMTLVHNDSINIPKTIGPYNITFTGGSPFTYNGGGVYVAFEYIRPSGVLPSHNTALCTTQNTSIKGVQGQDSVSIILSLGANSQSASPAKLFATNLRPETRFGSPDMKDSAEVSNVYALGNHANPYNSPTPISALIKNLTSASQTYAATLTVKNQTSNAVRFTNTQNVTVASYSSQIVTYTGWSPTLLENDSIIVSIPTQSGENVLVNNSNFYIQNVNTTICSYDDGTNAITSAGFDTAGGFLLNRHTMNGCGKINSAQIYLSSTAKNHPLRAILLNAAGAIIDSSSLFTPDSMDVNNYHSFYFKSTPTITNADYYIGLSQKRDSAHGYFPVGVQWEGNDIRDNAYYRADSTGGNLLNHPSSGRLMIRAEIIPAVPSVSIEGNSTLCTGGTNTLTALSTSTRFANKVLGFSSQSSGNQYSAIQALGTPNVFPLYNLNPLDWISNTADGQREFLALGFSNPGRINFIDIYETNNPGGVDTVYVKDPANGYVVVYSDSAVAAPPVSRIKHITFTAPVFNVSEIRIAINSPKITGYNAIDAVGIGFVDSANTAGATFSWIPGGATTQSINVSSIGTKSVTVNAAGACPVSASVNIVSYISNIPTISANRPTTLCVGDSSVILTSSITSGNKWSTGDTTRSITISTAVSSSNSYRVWNNAGSGCPADTSSPIVVAVNSLPVVSITGNLSICPGGSTTLGVNNVFSQYNWSTNSTNATISVNTARTVIVIVTNANGCKGSAHVITTIATPPHPLITGNLNFCPGSSTTLNAGSGYAGYSWSTTETTQTISVNTASIFSVTVTDANGCTGSTSVKTNLFIQPIPFITGNLFLCPGGSTTLNAGAGYANYSWSTLEITQTISVNTASTFTVTVTDFNGCTASTSATTNFFPVPTPFIIGNLSFCPGSSTSLIANSGYNHYSWSTLATTQLINVNSAGTFTVTVTDGNDCTASTSVQTQPYVLPIPAITGNLNVCPNSSTILDAGTNFQSYFWSTGAVSHSIFVNSAGIFSVTVKDYNGCSGSASVITTIANSTPNNVGPINGRISGLCNETGITYSVVPVSNATFYQWTVPAQAVITSGQGTTSINVNFGSFAIGFISIVALNNCGQSPVSTLQINSIPDMPGNISGPTQGVCSQNGIIYSIPSVPGATYYTWTLPFGGNIVSGQGTPSITVNFSNINSGDIMVIASNACGQSNPRLLSIQGAPALPANITGQTTLLCNQTNKIYSIPAVYGATTYTWTVPVGATILNGQGTPQITVKFSTSLTTGNICVIAKNLCGNSISTCISVTGIPNMPGAITGLTGVCGRQMNVVYSISPVPGASSYSWTVPSRATITSGQGTTSIKVTYNGRSGNVSVRAKSACGSSAYSLLVISITCREKAEQEVNNILDDIRAYPNPASDRLNINFNAKSIEQYSLRLYDVLGHTMISMKITSVEGDNNTELDLSGFAKGVYFLSVSNESSEFKRIELIVQ